MLKGTFLYTVAGVLPGMAGLIMLPIYSFYLSPEDYSVIALVETISVIFALVSTLAIDRALLRFYHDCDTPEEKVQLVSNCYFFTLFYSLLLFICAVLLQDYFQIIFKSVTFFPYIFISLVYTVLLSLNNLLLRVIQLQERSTAYLFLNLSRVGVTMLLMIYLVIYHEAGVMGHFVSQLVAALCIFIFLSVFLRKFLKCLPTPKQIKELIIFSIPYVPALAMALIANFSDRVILERFVSFEEIGRYFMAFKVASGYFIFSQAVVLAFTPVFYKLYKQGDLNDKTAFTCIESYFSIIQCGLISAALVIGLYSTELVKYLFSKDYAGIDIIIKIQLLSYLLASLNGVTSNLIYSQHKKTMEHMYIFVFMAISNVVANFMLIPHYGLVGAALATLASNFIASVIHYGYATRFSKVNIEVYFLYLSTFLLAAVFFLTSNFSVGVFNDILAKFIIIGLCVLCFWQKIKKPVLVVKAYGEI